MLLSVHNVSKSFGEDLLFQEVSFQVEAHDKMAIVGHNGCGKSTLLKILTGEMEADTGDVVLERDKTFGYLAQYQNDSTNATIYDYALSARADLLEMEERLRELEGKMHTETGYALERVMEQYHTLNHTFELKGGYSFRSEVSGVLKGLGFTEADFEKNLTQLSGGQKTRASLGRLLMSKPDLLLLDEPINHLDLSSIEWLEGFLANYAGAVIIVAHDRYFLDRIVHKVVDFYQKRTVVYKGNYSEFVRQKDERMLTLEREYEKQQKEIEHQEAVIEKLRQFNREKSIKRAESRMKMLDKIERMDRPTEEKREMTLTLEPVVQSGKDVLDIKGLSKAYDQKRLFSDLDIHITRGEHVALIGDNGTGKTTIFKILNGLVPADCGTITLGANVTVGYYDQEQQLLDEDKTLFDEMQDAYPNLDNTRVRNVLAAFLFREDDVYKRIRDLSGGERGRISLAKLMLSGANLLILDEPTNHLDMESKEILENALNHYEGTLFYVSHDRYFVNQTADRILELTADGLYEYLGDYDYYVMKKEERLAREAAVAATPSVAVTDFVVGNATEGKLDWEEQKRIAAAKRKKENEQKRIESDIETAEVELDQIDEQFNDPQVATNSAKLNELSAQRNEIQQQLEELYEQWEILMEDA
ncbi:MAG: ABC-F family ATP-binding cassette domain-containing protein [Lachnospiraceae bacterium]|nr:ABC-F family ATP-binding cassette domain-containing protein [Lachnospiraceae bacterium]